MQNICTKKIDILLKIRYEINFVITISIYVYITQ